MHINRGETKVKNLHTMVNSRVLIIYFALAVNVVTILVFHLPKVVSAKSHSHSHNSHNSHSTRHHHPPHVNPFKKHAILTLNNFARGGDGGSPSECDGRFHPLPERVVALSTELYEKGKHCGRMVKIRARNGRSTIAKVVDECDSRHGCKHNIVDGSHTVWKDLGLNIDVGEVPVTWSIL